MNSMIVFIAGLLIGGGILFTWALFQNKPDTTDLPKSFSDAILDRLPFDGEWFVFWGGDKAESNAHHGILAQHLALDYVIFSLDGEKTHKTEGKANEDYFCWGQPIFAAHDGNVVISVDGIPDNAPGEMNKQMVYGNTIMIQHESGFVSVYAHLKQGSVLKNKGDKVSCGEQIGLCGNSGNSSEPHLHFHVQNEIGFEQGVALRPLFRNIVINGVLKKNYSPIKSERTKNQNEPEQTAPPNR